MQDEELSFGEKLLNNVIVAIVMIILITVSLAGLMKVNGTFDRIEAVRQEKADYQNSLVLEENKKREKVQAEQDKLVKELVEDVSHELESQLIINPQILTGERNIILGDSGVSSDGDKVYKKFESNMENFVATKKSEYETKNTNWLLNDTKIILNILDGEYSLTT